MERNIQLDFFIKIMRKSEIQTLIFSLDDNINDIDLGLRKNLGIEENLFVIFKTFLKHLTVRRIYYVTDKFFFTYQILPINEKNYMLIGPYLSFMPSVSQIWQLSQEYNINSSSMFELEKYYKQFNVIHDNSPFYSTIHVLYEELWQDDINIQKMDINWEISNYIFIEHENSNLENQKQIKKIEESYEMERNFMYAVSKGDTKYVNNLKFDKIVKQRVADPIRDIKNYSIIMNTLLRKSAEYGGVHPLYLDKISDEFAHKIELLSSMLEHEKLMSEMVTSYCLMVQHHSIKKYSELIQHVILYINSNISTNLTLKNISNVYKVNASYLSNKFKKETGKTLTRFILEARIRLAVHLLGSTNLQIQTISQHCGILDVNYFCKLFKQFFNESPNEYRKKLKNLQI